jgi:hypothetical protein
MIYYDICEKNVLEFALDCHIKGIPFNPLRTEVYFCHQNQNAKNIGNFATLLKQ